MRHSNVLLTATTAIGLLASAAALALQPIEGVFRHGDAVFLSGGVGESGRDRTQALADEYDFDVKLVFAAEDGAYLGMMPVTITDAAGKTVLRAVSEGPWLYADLQPGNYSVRVEREGTVREDSFTVGGGGDLQEVTFTFPVMRNQIAE